MKKSLQLVQEFIQEIRNKSNPVPTIDREKLSSNRLEPISHSNLNLITPRSVIRSDVVLSQVNNQVNQMNNVLNSVEKILQ